MNHYPLEKGKFYDDQGQSLVVHVYVLIFASLE